MFPLLGFFSRADMLQVIRLRYFWPNHRSNWILGRHACLGRDVIDMTNNRLPIFNLQKGRIDFLFKALKKNSLRTRTKIIVNYLSRKDIIPFLRQQEYCRNIPRHPPSMIYMDSFSELADQLFIHKDERWETCCCYSDVNHTEDFKGIFEEKGLLNIDELEPRYRDFFNLIRAKYGDVPIVFLHFPSALEARPKYLERSAAIVTVIEKLAKEYNRLYSISVDESLVSPPTEVAPELIDFPYHYNKETYHSFATKFNDILLGIVK
jgi:hypothetical protein